MYKIPCNNCNGKGKIDHFKHIEDGICFKCSGLGLMEVSKELYLDYQETQKRALKGKYILFNNGSIEYYKTVKQIEKQYGNFFTGEYGNFAVHISYNDKNVVYTNHTENSDKFIEETKKQYNKQILKKIDKQKEMLIDEDDQEFIELINAKIKELESILL